MTSKKKSKKKSGDWFDELDAELDEKTEETIKNLDEKDSKLADLNREFIKDFWRVWIRFEKLHVHFSMVPDNEDFANFEEFPHEWEFKDDFDFADVRMVKLMDRSQADNRTGDSLVIEYYNDNEDLKVGMFFEFCEGESYYKYSGWKRIFARYSLMDYKFPMSNKEMDKYHDILKEAVKIWYESHLKGDHSIIIDHIKENYDKIEEYPE